MHNLFPEENHICCEMYNVFLKGNYICCVMNSVWLEGNHICCVLYSVFLEENLICYVMCCVFLEENHMFCILILFHSFSLSYLRLELPTLNRIRYKFFIMVERLFNLWKLEKNEDFDAYMKANSKLSKLGRHPELMSTIFEKPVCIFFINSMHL